MRMNVGMTEKLKPSFFEIDIFILINIKKLYSRYFKKVYFMSLVLCI